MKLDRFCFAAFGSNSQWPYLYLWNSLWAWNDAGQLSAVAVASSLHSSFWLLLSLHFRLLNFLIARQITLGIASFGITMGNLIKQERQLKGRRQKGHSYNHHLQFPPSFDCGHTESGWLVLWKEKYQVTYVN